jgi:acetyl-CoA/propionyl-CoA carboxylase carboxyl transferase subunit
VMGGSLSEENGRKICKLMDLAERYGLPLIGINDSGGARIQEGVRSLASYAEIFRRNTELSGDIPQISLIMGPCAGGAVYSPAISDLIFMVEDTSFMYVTGPEVVKTVTREEMSHRELGGSDVHRSESGVADRIGEADKNVLDLAIQALSYLPDNRDDVPDRLDPEPPSVSTPLKEIVPEDKTRPYDVREVIGSLVDGGSFMELKPDFAQNIVVGFARLDGHAIGVVANQPKYNAGTLDIDASDKGARFVRMCDNFNLPILTLEDVPGFMPGKDQETGGIIRHGAKLLYAYAEAQVPLITLITRKAYGGAYCVMASKHLGADFNFAWPMAELAVMGPESAVEILHGDDIQNAEDPQAKRQQKLEELRFRFGNPWEAARRGYLDDVIKADESRSRLINALDIAMNGRDDDRRNPHGNIPL